MSDEEKKAIEVLNYIKNKTPFIFWYEDKPYNRKETINTVLNLIEKQQKEIEELKEKNIKAGNLLAKRITMCNKAQCELEDYIENKELINQTLGLEKNANINKTLEKIIILNNYVDKIKAKIEELDYDDIANFERRCKQEVLQSLLEKE